MKNEFIIVSAYTKNTPYETEIYEKLYPSLQNHELLYHIIDYPNQKNWIYNCYLKANAILDGLIKYPLHDVVWLDSDAIVRKYPVWFNRLMVDIAYHQRGNRLSSGTLFFKNNEKVKELVQKWIIELYENRIHGSQKWEGDILKELLTANDHIEIGYLPLSYSTIFDKEQPEDEIVIEHFQASRRNKQLV